MRLGRTTLVWLALAAAVWGAVVLITGGFVWEIGSLHLSSRAALRPLLLSTALTVLHIYKYGRLSTVTDIGSVARWLGRPSVLAGGAAIAACWIGMTFGAYAIGGSDSYGYVSQADLWLRGNLRVEQPFVGELRWPNAALTMTPLGYIPTGQAGTFVPMYPPGFPLTLALLIAAWGSSAAFVVVPLFGAVAVWLTYRLGRVVLDESTGVIAAVLLLASPAFLIMLVSAPMSDIPALTWWLLAVVCAADYQGRYVHLLVSGLSTSMAILTRPNLAPLGALLPVLIALLAPNWSIALRRAARWVAPALVGPLVLAWLNNTLYGSPLGSGYGQEILSEFSWTHVWPNAKAYSRWLLETQTPFMICGLAAPLLLEKTAGSRRSVILCWWCVAFAAAVATSYLSYTVFGVWWYLRFLLPAYPMLLVTSAAVAVVVTRRLGRLQLPALVLLAGLVFARGVIFANGELVFSLGSGEYRYKEAGDYVKGLASNTVVISFQHSGSLRYYANVLTVRYDVMEPTWLDRTIEYLSDTGHPVYAVLDPGEVELVRKRFSSASSLSWLSQPPIQVTAHGVRIYELSAVRP